jgi:hypothetical protein
MKLLPSFLKTVLLGLLVAAFAVTASAQDNRIQMSQLDRFADLADKVIDVTVDEGLIKLAMSALSDKRSPDEAKIKEILTGLKGVYVKRFEFEKESQYTSADIEAIRAQFNAPGWTRIANVRSKREGSFDVVMMYEGSIVKGIAVLAAEPRALTVVNVIGAIDISKLRDLEGKFGIPSFGLEQVTGMGVTVKDNRKDKTSPPDHDPARQHDDPDAPAPKRTEKKPPQLARPEKPPVE